jgi:RNA ligase (TIGR02306 family)
MSTFSCPVARVASVEPHPEPDTTRLNVVKLEGLGFTLVRNKTEQGEPRDKVGDLVVYIPSSAVLPEWLLKEMGFWNAELGKGTLAGTDGNRVKPLKLRGVFSEGVLYPVEWDDELAMEGGGSVVAAPDPHNSDMHNLTQVELGEDVSELLGITKWEPAIPAHMAGEVANMIEYMVKYDFERHERVPLMFEPGEPVTATEKLHGTNMAITWVPELAHAEMFGADQNILVSSKGLGAQGLAFKNNEANANNLYVRILRDLLSKDFEAKLLTLVATLTDQMQLMITTPLPVRIWGEVYGAGVQDLHYGTKHPEFAVFDILIGERWLTDLELAVACAHLGVRKAPLAYKGPFDVAALEAVRDGATLMGGTNIREGIVVRSENLLPHDSYGRRICKMISPDYLTRKAKNATEFQ